MRGVFFVASFLVIASLGFYATAQMAPHTSPDSAKRNKVPPRSAAQRSDASDPPKPNQLPQLVDITGSTGIKFEHLSSPEQKYIVESMSGGVALIDYDRDGWPDIYFTNAPDVDMQGPGKKPRSAFSHKNRDGTF